MKPVPDLIRRAATFGILGLVVLGLNTGCNSRNDGAGTAGTSDQHVLTLTAASFKTEVLSSSQPVLVDFWATWCGPCKMVAPTVAELASEFEGKAKVGKVDVDKEPSLAQEYSISAIPALLIFKDGKVVEQFVGVRSKGDLKAALEKHIGTAAKESAPAK